MLQTSFPPMPPPCHGTDYLFVPAESGSLDFLCQLGVIAAKIVKDVLPECHAQSILGVYLAPLGHNESCPNPRFHQEREVQTCRAAAYTSNSHISISLSLTIVLCIITEVRVSPLVGRPAGRGHGAGPRTSARTTPQCRPS